MENHSVLDQTSYIEHVDQQQITMVNDGIALADVESSYSRESFVISLTCN